MTGRSVGVRSLAEASTSLERSVRARGRSRVVRFVVPLVALALSIGIASPANAFSRTSGSPLVSGWYVYSGATRVNVSGYTASIGPGNLLIDRYPGYRYGQYICAYATVWYRTGSVTGSGWGSKNVMDQPYCTFVTGQDRTAFPAFGWSLTTGNFVHVAYHVEWWDYYGTTRLAYENYDGNASSDYVCAVAQSQGTSCSVSYQFSNWGVSMQ